MASPLRITAAVAGVLEAFLAAPGTERYGLDIMQATGYPSGTVYPILMRLQKAGWLAAHWEEIDPVAAGRPARRWYRLTPDGLTTARTELAAHRQRNAIGPAVRTRPTWAS
ncbi:PadR family transcriptional regulator [Actinoplanes sp. SE50]|uniref:PadR family transcriptional regulator n=1 Tax=unclassified Actinoplanes TaxID=2626549 RepID=UPI00023EC4CA|nr:MULTISPECIES: PadR family transcriptional regulator [unclassified Actinoplanes]AEV85874.1 transcriptional regulator, PadR-like family [Actinoplanes sp. SE50/110]ATO84270.1 PadR family transcriptional regulator [Actinoplanes sp. SE50]SLM01680.1 PadR family transcriptional regulator [Actinoplanes sp. SE50/110]